MSFRPRPTLVLAPVLLLTGCEPPAPPEPEAMLTVTWVTPGQAPQTSKTPMRDLAACEDARVTVTAARRAAAFQPPDERSAAGASGASFPQISAVCIETRRR